MTNPEQDKTGVNPEQDQKLTLDKEEVKDLEPKPEDQEQIRGGLNPCACGTGPGTWNLA
jgi:hypothetical protein